MRAIQIKTSGRLMNLDSITFFTYGKFSSQKMVFGGH